MSSDVKYKVVVGIRYRVFYFNFHLVVAPGIILYYRVSEPYWTHEDLHKSVLKAFFQLIPLLITLYPLGVRQNFA